MSQILKKINRFLKNSTSVKYSDLRKILSYFEFKEIVAKGSHTKFKHPRLKYDLIIPVHKGECKDFYKEEARKLIIKISKDI